MDKDNKWFCEPVTEGFKHKYRIKKTIEKRKTKYQEIEIFDTVSFGRMLVLDGAVQTSEDDEYYYHEMLVHIPLFTHQKPETVLIIGGGDGGALRRVLEHPVKKVIQVELDKDVVKTCLEHLPGISKGAFNDKRVELLFEDGIKFIKEKKDIFDVIIIDSPDPKGPAKKLFTHEFYKYVYRALKEDGLIVTQSCSPLYQKDMVKMAYSGLKSVFPIVKMYLGFVPTYPGGLWSYTLASKKFNPLTVGRKEIEKRMKSSKLDVKVYSPENHHSFFILAQSIIKMIGDS